MHLKWNQEIKSVQIFSSNEKKDWLSSNSNKELNTEQNCFFMPIIRKSEESKENF